MGIDILWISGDRFRVRKRAAYVKQKINDRFLNRGMMPTINIGTQGSGLIAQGGPDARGRPVRAMLVGD